MSAPDLFEAATQRRGKGLPPACAREGEPSAPAPAPFYGPAAEAPFGVALTLRTADRCHYAHAVRMADGRFFYGRPENLSYTPVSFAPAIAWER